MIWLIATAGALRLYLSLLGDFFVNRMGDVQTYTTHDENLAFFGIREVIIMSRRARHPDGRSGGHAGRQRQERLDAMSSRPAPAQATPSHCIQLKRSRRTMRASMTVLAG